MHHLPTDATDDDLIAFADQWASLLEAEDTRQHIGSRRKTRACNGPHVPEPED